MFHDPQFCDNKMIGIRIWLLSFASFFIIFIRASCVPVLPDRGQVAYCSSMGMSIAIRLLLPVMALLMWMPSGCHRIPVTSGMPVRRIQVGPGPEDMVLDTLQGESRLIISCTARRETEEPFGEMVACLLPSGEVRELVRLNEPAGLLFRPHGIYLDRDLLYVISHEREPDDHPVLIYRLKGDTLLFTEAVRTPLQHSPNALVTGPGGEIFLVNDAGKRGSIMEKMLKLKRASVVRIARNGEGEWDAATVASGLGYPAGINRLGETLFVGDAILHRIHIYTISGRELLPAGEIRGLRGNDNIRIHEGRLLVPGHIRPFRFIAHAGHPDRKSPVAVFEADPRSGESRVLYADDGSAISAGSTALIYRDKLYISQVFGSYLLEVER